MTDPIADMLARLRNAGLALKPQVELPHSKLKESIARIFQREGYLADCAVEGKTIKKLKLRLKFQGKKSAIEGMKRVSKPGLRHYVGADEIPRVLAGMGVAILSTPRGVMTGNEARKQNLGGEVLCYIW
jgi:small subunit ribosomal protein S8